MPCEIQGKRRNTEPDENQIRIRLLRFQQRCCSAAGYAAACFNRHAPVLLLERTTRRCNCAKPNSQSPSSDSALMCPSEPALTKSLPHCFAQNAARSLHIQGSLLLPITIVGNDKGLPATCKSRLNFVGSAGATNNAPAIFSDSPRALCTVARHPKLCALITPA